MHRRDPACRPLLTPSLSVLALAALTTTSQAQTAPAGPPPAAPAASAPAASASSPAPQLLAPVVVTGTRANDMQERRQSTAAKIVIGREEIDRFGDSTVGEVLKRLPGITLQGAPGRGGAIRMRGLGSGYTQILLDGERTPPGFSIDSLSPEQIERIEILRAPTAETGARAIAGTINIITREGFKKRLNNLRLGTSYENGRWQPGLSWTRNDTVGEMIYNVSLSALQLDRKTDTNTRTVHEDFLPVPATTVSQEASQSHEKRGSLHATGRLQWRGEKGSSLVLMPLLIHSHIDTQSSSRFTQEGGTAPYDRSQGSVNGDYTNLRLNGQWNQQVEGAGRVELKAGLGQGNWSGRTIRTLYKDDGSPTIGNVDDVNSSRGTTATLGSKYTALLANDHSFVTGAEVENFRSSETHSQVDDSGDDFSASSLRLAAYAQDEWNLTPQWAVHLGLRWEGIRTHSDAAQAGASVSDVSNRSSVWTPLFHTVWKPDPKSRDQVRLSLTRSYRSPTLQNLIARPRESSANSPTRPDRAGNPNLRPELATGLDVAVERYLEGGGILSANLFHRQISDYMRSVTSLEGSRYVSRVQNVGDAVTQGIELEAKFRLSDVVSDAPPVDVRANASAFQSRVKPVPGPDNRLDQQPGGTVNLGADYRFRGTPLTLGGNLNWTPGYTTRISETQWVLQGRKLVGDAYVLCFLSPNAQVRLTASNFAPRDYLTGGSFQNTDFREASETTANSYINWQLRLEMKL
jgi:outer membrane receptor for ferrienterochelin and colicins